ncbi:MAG: hypothetical protein ACYCVA_04325 [Sulfobacillus sp.]
MTKTLFAALVIAALLGGGDLLAPGAVISGGVLAPTRLQVWLTGPVLGLAPPSYPPIAVVTNTQQVRSLYAAMRTLKPWPKGVYACPEMSNVAARLDFSSASGVVATALFSPTGCSSVTFDGKWLRLTPSFEALFYQTMGLDAADFY